MQETNRMLLARFVPTPEDLICLAKEYLDACYWYQFAWLAYGQAASQPLAESESRLVLIRELVGKAQLEVALAPVHMKWTEQFEALKNTRCTACRDRLTLPLTNPHDLCEQCAAI